jgi:antitoxin ParD1/3/4
MGEITSIVVSDELVDFIRSLIDHGRYSSESEVVEEALRLLKEEDDAAIDAIRAAIDEGEASGEPRALDFDEFIAEMRRKHGS